MDAAAAVLAGRDWMRPAADDGLAAVAGLIDKAFCPTPRPRRAGSIAVPDVRNRAGVRDAQLTAAGERDEALEGLVRYCTAEASLAESGLAGRAQVEWLNRVHDDLDSYRGALAWLIEHRRGAEACGDRLGTVALLGDPEPCGRSALVVRGCSQTLCSTCCPIEGARGRSADVADEGRDGPRSKTCS